MEHVKQTPSLALLATVPELKLGMALVIALVLQIVVQVVFILKGLNAFLTLRIVWWLMVVEPKLGTA